MKNLNSVVLTGQLTRDPISRITPNEVPVTNFSIAVNRPKGKNGENGVDFIDCTAWRGLANVCKEYLKKGRAVAVQGRLHIDKYEGKDGQKKTATYVLVDNMQMLDRKQPQSPLTEEAEVLTAF